MMHFSLLICESILFSSYKKKRKRRKGNARNAGVRSELDSEKHLSLSRNNCPGDYRSGEPIHTDRSNIVPRLFAIFAALGPSWIQYLSCLSRVRRVFIKSKRSNGSRVQTLNRRHLRKGMYICTGFNEDYHSIPGFAISRTTKVEYITG